MSKLLLGGVGTGGEEAAKGVSFDGVSDYLSRSTDLVGNTDSKTFTFSCWVYRPTTTIVQHIYTSGLGFEITLRPTDAQSVNILARNSAGTTIFNAYVVLSDYNALDYTNIHILASVDLTNSTLRSVYINDKPTTVTWSTYTNDFVDFTLSSDKITIASNRTGLSSRFKGRLSNVFLDYTYRDLSIEANRRLFITEDLKPADGLNSVDMIYSNRSAVVSAGETSPNSCAISSDGSLFFVSGTTLDYIQVSTLSVPYVLETASHSYSFNPSVSNPQAIWFSPTGHKFYILGQDDYIHEWTLTNSYDLSVGVNKTGSFLLGSGTWEGLSIDPTGTKLAVVENGNNKVDSWTFGTSWDVSTLTKDSETFSFSAYQNDPHGLYVTPDGSKMFILCNNSHNSWALYDLISPWDVSSAVFNTYLSSLGRPFNNSGYDIRMSDDGIFVYVVDYTLEQDIYNYKLDAPFDIFSRIDNVANNPQPPILYLPMDDADTAHINLGTGGDFTPNGVLDTAQRGANQWNCVASRFNGVNDLLSSTSLNLSDSKEITISVNFKYIFQTRTGILYIRKSSITDNILILQVRNSGDLYLFTHGGSMYIRTPNDFILPNVEYSLTISMNTATQVGHIILNGVDVTQDMISFNIAADGTIPLSSYVNFEVGRENLSGNEFEGVLGELYFDTNYIDLASDNPFWDSTANKPKPVRQVLEETGNTPLIAMPISADNPTLNLGTGGDFTLNGGGLVGARGASEFWARSADSNLTNQGSTTYTRYLQALSPFSNSVTELTIVIAAKTIDRSATNYPCMMSFIDGIGHDLLIKSDSGEDFAVGGVENGAYLSEDNVFTVKNVWHFYAVTFKSVDVPSWRLFNLKNRTQVDTGTSQGPYDYSAASGTMVNILSGGDGTNSGDDWAGAVSSIYAIEQYIDFTQEENLNLFVDQLGYPKDLSKQIADGLIPEPLIYLPFDDPDYLGKNLGTGGDFTVNGTVTQGADFSL